MYCKIQTVRSNRGTVLPLRILRLVLLSNDSFNQNEVKNVSTVARGEENVFGKSLYHARGAQ